MGLESENEKIVGRFLALKEQLDFLLKANQSRQGHLQNYLYFTYAPVFNYTEAIIILCNHGKYNAASALLRTLFEAHINIIYHQVDDSEKRLAISVRARFIQLEKSFSGVCDLIKKYPSQSSSDKGDLFNKEYLEEALSKIHSNLTVISSSSKLTGEDRELNVLCKAKKCDDAKISAIQEGHFERMYHVIYRQLSPSVHLDILGLESFIDVGKDGKHIFKETYSGDILIVEAIGICIALAKDLYENGVLEGDIPEIVVEVENLIKESKRSRVYYLS